MIIINGNPMWITDIQRDIQLDRQMLDRHTKAVLNAPLMGRGHNYQNPSPQCSLYDAKLIDLQNVSLYRSVKPTHGHRNKQQKPKQLKLTKQTKPIYTPILAPGG